MMSWRLINNKICLLIVLFCVQGSAFSQSITRGPYLQKATSTSMLVRWYTDVNVDGKVMYGTDPGNLSQSAVSGAATSHSVQLSGLTPYTKYYYSIGTSTTTLQSGLDNYFLTSPLPNGEGNFELAPLKHELAEIALVEPPAELDGIAITVMDGPFFSMMPYPSEQLHSLTHVRYTPHFGWTDAPTGTGVRQPSSANSPPSRWRHMMLDAQRYVPSMAEIEYRNSIFETKTVLLKNERDDGRPILLSSHEIGGKIYSILGAKIDNIYDIFEIIPKMRDEWSSATAKNLLSLG